MRQLEPSGTNIGYGSRGKKGRVASAQTRPLPGHWRRPRDLDLVEDLHAVGEGNQVIAKIPSLRDIPADGMVEAGRLGNTLGLVAYRTGSTAKRAPSVVRGDRSQGKSQGDSPAAFERGVVQGFSSLEPQACPPERQRRETFGRHPQDLGGSATDSLEAGDEESPDQGGRRMAALAATTPELGGLEGSALLFGSTVKGSDPSSTLKRGVLQKQHVGSPGLPARACGQSFSGTGVTNPGRLVALIPGTAEQGEEKLRMPAAGSKARIQPGAEAELAGGERSRSQLLLQEALDAQKEQQQQQDQIGGIEGADYGNLDEIEKRIIDEGLQASNAAVGRHVTEQALGLRKQPESDDLDESSSLQFAEAIQMRQNPMHDDQRQSADSAAHLDLEGEQESPSPPKIPQARYTSIDSIKAGLDQD